MDRLFKSGLITTITGLLIIGAAVIAWYKGKADSTEALAIGGLGLVFLRSKDSLIGIQPKDQNDAGNKG
jgi:hypothetical protein